MVLQQQAAMRDGVQGSSVIAVVITLGAMGTIFLRTAKSRSLLTYRFDPEYLTRL
jgi:hypothetical protein